MNTTKEERKERALQAMKELGIFEGYIKDFKRDDDYVCYYENYAGFWAWQDKELLDKVRDIEEHYNCTVFAITHEYTNFGECYDFLVISDYKDEWDNYIEKVSSDEFYVFAYVWNKDFDYDSEFGTIGIKSFGGGLRRYA